MFNLVDADSSWQPLLQRALATMDQNYLNALCATNNWLPGQQNIFNAFKLPLNKTRYILFGESPYPRATSANGYAFWDAAVGDIWSEIGMTKGVNRATSLRNYLKMLMICNQGLTPEDTSQAAIAAVNKENWVSTLNDLFTNMLKEGFLLLNATLALTDKPVQQESRFWAPFITSILKELSLAKPDIKLILLGKIATSIQQRDAASGFHCVVAEHPYNVSFINNTAVQNFFKPFNLLGKRDKLSFSK